MSTDFIQGRKYRHPTLSPLDFVKYSISDKLCQYLFLNFFEICCGQANADGFISMPNFCGYFLIGKEFLKAIKFMKLVMIRISMSNPV